MKKLLLILCSLFFPIVGSADTLTEEEINRQMKEEMSYYGDNIEALNQMDEAQEDDVSSMQEGRKQKTPSANAKFIREGRKFLRTDKSYGIYQSCPVTGKTFPKKVTESKYYTDDFVIVHEGSAKVYDDKSGAKYYYEHVFINGNDVGWINRNAFRKNELTTVNVKMSKVDETNPFYQNYKDKLSKYAQVSGKESYVSGIDDEGYMIEPFQVSGSSVNTTNEGTYSYSVSTDQVKKQANISVLSSDGVRPVETKEADIQYKLIDNSEWASDINAMPSAWGITKNIAHHSKDSCKDKTDFTNHNINSDLAESKRHSYVMTGLEGSGTFKTNFLLMERAFPKPYESKLTQLSPAPKNNIRSNARINYGQGLVALGDSFYTAMVNSNNDDVKNDLGIIIRYKKSLAKESLNAVRAGTLFKDDSERFKRVCSQISVSEPMTMGHGQGLTSDGKQLRILVHHARPTKEAINYETSGILTVDPISLKAKEKVLWRQIITFPDNQSCRARGFTKVLAWKPNTSTFYTMCQYVSNQNEGNMRLYGNQCTYEIFEHQMDTQGNVTSKLKFRIKSPVSRYYLKNHAGNRYVACQGMIYDPINDAIVLLGDGQYEAFKENRTFLDEVYVSQLNNDCRESEGLYFEQTGEKEGKVHLLLSNFEEILTMDYPYTGDRFGAYQKFGKYVTVWKKGYGVYQDKDYKKKVMMSDDIYQKTYYAKGYYDLANGAMYYSLYNNDDQWVGYLNKNAVRIGHADGTQAGGAHISVKQPGTIIKSGYRIWQDLNFSKIKSRTDDKVNQTVWIGGKYHHINGNVYYSLYDKEGGTWLGYLNKNAVELKTTLSLVDESEETDESVSLDPHIPPYQAVSGRDER